MSHKQSSTTQEHSAFWHRFLNNQTVINLLIVLLVMLIIVTFTKISHLFDPVRAIVGLLALPVIGAGILYYLFKPLVSRLKNLGMDKRLAVWLIFIVAIVFIVLGINSLIPILQDQWKSLIHNLPRYQRQINRFLDTLPGNNVDIGFWNKIENALMSFDLPHKLNELGASTFSGLGNVLGTVSKVVAGLLTLPILLYYLLTEDYMMFENILHVVPTKHQETVKRILCKSNSQVSRYIRGQVIVAIVVAILFAVGYSIIGLEYGLLLAVISGLFNVVPYLGSIVSVVPALIVASLTSPSMVLKAILVIAIEQTIEGRFVSPQILGTNLKIHPMTILVVLLISGRLFGVSGVIIGVPTYAVLRVIVTELYHVHREHSHLYDPE